MDDMEPRLAKAMVRYEVISAYRALEPRRGQRKKLLEQLAAKTWIGADGEPFQVAAETIRVWLRRYRVGGLEGLMDAPHPTRGAQSLSPEQIELAARLKHEVPDRSLDRLIRIMEEMELIERGTIKRSTLHRVLKAKGLSARRCRTPDAQDLDRFEADRPGDLWQSDMLVGPWLPDPSRPGKTRRAYLYAFLDDHSRLLLHGRFSFKGDLPALELVFRRCLQKYGVPRRVYYDNGQTYRSHHMRHIVAALGIHRLVFTTPRRPMGHGKIEALNRYIRSAFIAEAKASAIVTLDELNEAFVAWADLEYNRRVHAETRQAPIDRWRTGLDKVCYADEEKLRQAFMWREKRTTDKAGVFSLLGQRYQLSPGLGKRRIEVCYDPEALHQVEVWHHGRFRERITPFEVSAHRRPKAAAQTDQPQASETPPTKPAADWIGHLVAKRRATIGVEPSPRQLADADRARREQADQAIIDLLEERLDSAIINIAAIRQYLDRFGPLDSRKAETALDRFLSDGAKTDHHIVFYLNHLKTTQEASS